MNKTQTLTWKRKHTRTRKVIIWQLQKQQWAPTTGSREDMPSLCGHGRLQEMIRWVESERSRRKNILGGDDSIIMDTKARNSIELQENSSQCYWEHKVWEGAVGWKGINYEELWSQVDLVTAIAAEKQNIPFPTWQCSLGEQLGYLWPQNPLSGSC